MDRLLRLKHWQLFLLVFGAPFVLQFFLAAALAMNPNSMVVYSVIPVVMLLFIVIFFGWFYALGTNLHRLLPESVTMSLTRFRIFLIIPAIYIVFICVFMFFIFNNVYENNEPINFGLFGLIIPVHLFSMFCIFYCFYFNAKALKAVEWQRPVTFGDFASEFFLLWFYPIGIWIIQPRVNKLFEKTHDLPNEVVG